MGRARREREWGQTMSSSKGRGKIVPVAKLMLSAALMAAILPGSIEGRGESRVFPETGKTVSGRFFEYWDSHGGLMQQGYPVSEEMQEVSETDGKAYTVQYFERAVFEG